MVGFPIEAVPVLFPSFCAIRPKTARLASSTWTNRNYKQSPNTISKQVINPVIYLKCCSNNFEWFFVFSDLGRFLKKKVLEDWK